MTQQELITKIREKVIKACPDIMELKFGCKIKNKNGALDTIVTYSNYGNFLENQSLDTLEFLWELLK